MWNCNHTWLKIIKYKFNIELVFKWNNAAVLSPVAILQLAESSKNLDNIFFNKCLFMNGFLLKINCVNLPTLSLDYCYKLYMK